MNTVKLLLTIGVFIFSSCSTKRFSGPCGLAGMELYDYVKSDVDRGIRGGISSPFKIFDTLNYQISVFNSLTLHTKKSILFIKHDKNCYYFNDRKFGKSKPLIKSMINEYTSITGKTVNVDSLNTVIADKMEPFTMDF